MLLSESVTSEAFDPKPWEGILSGTSVFLESRAANPQSNLPPGKQQTKMHPVPSRGRISLAFRAVFCSQAAILASLSGARMEKARLGLVASPIIERGILSGMMR